MAANTLQRLTRKLWRADSNRPLPPEKELAPAQLRAVRLAEKFPPIYRFRPSIARKLYHALEQPFSLDKANMAKVQDNRIDLEAGSGLGEVGLRSYYPCKSSVNGHSPAMVYYHGGGGVIGSIDTHDRLCRFIAEKTGLVILSVDYRCAPQAKFPIPVEDAIFVWNWVADNARRLGIDIDQTGVGGDSAGAYLATSLCIQFLSPELKQQPTRMPAYQWLIYPMLDLRGEAETYKHCQEGMLLTGDFMFYLRDHFLNDPAERLNPIASPILTPSLTGLPPSYILTVEHDPLLAQGRTYVERLRADASPVAHEHCNHCMHGFVSFAGVCPHANNTLIKAIDGLAVLARGQSASYIPPDDTTGG